MLVHISVFVLPELVAAASREDDELTIHSPWQGHFEAEVGIVLTKDVIVHWSWGTSSRRLHGSRCIGRKSGGGGSRVSSLGLLVHHITIFVNQGSRTSSTGKFRHDIDVFWSNGCGIVGLVGLNHFQRDLSWIDIGKLSFALEGKVVVTIV
jgi:hypothetical protein